GLHTSLTNNQYSSDWVFPPSLRYAKPKRATILPTRTYLRRPTAPLSSGADPAPVPVPFLFRGRTPYHIPPDAPPRNIHTRSDRTVPSPIPPDTFRRTQSQL